MAINTITPLTSLMLAAGMHTAYTAPSGSTAIMVKSISVTPSTALSAGSSISAYMLVGPTAAPRLWLPLTGFGGGTAFRDQNVFIPFSAVGAGVIFSSNSAGLDVYLGGLRITP